jgi:hypothetical protein
MPDEFVPRPCVGCGYCCQAAPCVVGFMLYQRVDGQCPALVWNEEQQRYLCQVVLDEPEATREDLKQKMAMGEGCCSPMFNTQRDEQIARMRRRPPF